MNGVPRDWQLRLQGSVLLIIVLVLLGACWIGAQIVIALLAMARHG